MLKQFLQRSFQASRVAESSEHLSVAETIFTFAKLAGSVKLWIALALFLGLDRTDDLWFPVGFDGTVLFFVLRYLMGKILYKAFRMLWCEGVH